MKYWLAEFGNGYCGCEESWVISTKDDNEPEYEDVLEYYPYVEGFCGDEYLIEEYEDANDFWLDYEQNIADNSSITEIPMEEAKFLIDYGYELIEM